MESKRFFVAGLLSYALERQVQIDVALFRFAEGTNFPRLGRHVHIAALAAYP